MSLVVAGVDGGNTKTEALVAGGDGALLGYGRSGCGNYEGPGVEAARNEIRKALETAIAQAGVDAQNIATCCFGLAGADFPEDFVMLQEAMGELGIARKVIIENDAIIGLRAGTTLGCGAAVIMGGGTKTVGRAPDGREVRFPGEGYLFGDWGGGHAVADEVLHRVFRAHQGRGKPTALMPRVLEALGASDMEDLTRRLYREQITSAQRMSLTPLCFRVAAEGDEVAQKIISMIGEETAVSAAAVLGQLNLLDQPADVVLIGSLFTKGEGPLLLDTVRARLGELAPLARPVPLRHPPVVGAVLLALEDCGIVVGDAVMARLDATVASIIPAAPSG